MRPLRYMPVWQLSLTKIRELVREPEALFWVFVFPILLALALGIAFRSSGPEEVAVGVQQGPGAEAIERARCMNERMYATVSALPASSPSSSSSSSSSSTSSSSSSSFSGRNASTSAPPALPSPKDFGSPEE